MPTEDSSSDKAKTDFFERFGRKLDRCVSQVLKYGHGIKNKYNDLNSDYVKNVRSHKVFRILPPSLIVLFLFVIFIPFFVSQITQNNLLMQDTGFDTTISATGAIYDNAEFSQAIQYDARWSEISSIDILIGTYSHRNPNTKYQFILEKDGDKVYEETITTSSIDDDGYYQFKLNDPLVLEGEGILTFYFRALGVSESDAISLFRNDSGDIIYRVYRQSDFQFFVILVSIILLSVYCLFNVLINSGKIKSEFSFLAFMLIYIVSLVFIYPVYTVPDEPYHFLGALRLTEYDWSMSPYDNLSRKETHLPENSECLDTYFASAGTPGLITQSELTECFASTPTTLGVHDVVAANTDRIIVYAPAALGIMFGKLVSDSPMIIFYCGRLFNLILISVIIVYALRLIKKHRILLLAVVFIPMFLQQAVSYSYDGLLNALCILMIAYGIRFLTMDVKVRKRDVAVMAISLVIITIIKPPYILIAAPLLFVKSEKFGKYKITKWIVGIALLMVIGSMYLLNSHIEDIGNSTVATAVDYSSPDERGFPIEVFAHPRFVAKMFLRTFRDVGYFYLRSTIGTFGWFYFELSSWIIWIWVAFLLIAILSSSEKKLNKLTRAALLFISIVAILLILTSMFLGWTHRDSPVIEGVQGRYFLPIIPLLMLAIIPQKAKIKLSENTVYSFLGLMTLTFLITLLVGFY